MKSGSNQPFAEVRSDFLVRDNMWNMCNVGNIGNKMSYLPIACIEVIIIIINAVVYVTRCVSLTVTLGADGVVVT